MKRIHLNLLKINFFSERRLQYTHSTCQGLECTHKNTFRVFLDSCLSVVVLAMSTNEQDTWRSFPARQNGDFGRNLAYFLLIFRLFSSYGTPSIIFPPTCLQNSPISSYFPPKMVPHPCYKLKHGTHLLFFRPHVYRFYLFSAYIPLIFCLFST